MANNDETDQELDALRLNEERADWRREKSTALRDRLIFLLDDLAPNRGKYAYLESRTGISAASWQNLYLEKQMPTLDMILAVSEYRYPYLSWLITGQDPTDASAQQMSRAPTDEKWEAFRSHRAWLRTSKKKG